MSKKLNLLQEKRDDLKNNYTISIIVTLIISLSLFFFVNLFALLIFVVIITLIGASPYKISQKIRDVDIEIAEEEDKINERKKTQKKKQRSKK